MFFWILSRPQYHMKTNFMLTSQNNDHKEACEYNFEKKICFTWLQFSIIHICSICPPSVSSGTFCSILLLCLCGTEGLSVGPPVQKLTYGWFTHRKAHPVDTKQRWFLTSCEVVSIPGYTFGEGERMGSGSSTDAIRALYTCQALNF